MFVWTPGARVLVQAPQHLRRSTQWHSYRCSNILCYHKGANSKVKLMAPLIGTVKQTNCHNDSLTDSQPHTHTQDVHSKEAVCQQETTQRELECVHFPRDPAHSDQVPSFRGFSCLLLWLPACLGAFCWFLKSVPSCGSVSSCLTSLVFSGYRTSLKRLKISPKGNPMESRERCIVLNLCRFKVQLFLEPQILLHINGLQL